MENTVLFSSLLSLEERIFSVKNEEELNHIALELFQLHRLHNPFYKLFIDNLFPTGFHPEHYTAIPCLPVDFFKTQKIGLFPELSHLIFKSSGTSGQQPSHHYVYRPEVYRESLLRGFEMFYGSPVQYGFIALLPGYLEREDASLVYMMKVLMEKAHFLSGFYKNNYQQAIQQIEKMMSVNIRVFVLGVSHALLQMADQYPVQLLENAIVMETGGMKGHGKEYIREALHEKLQKGFGTHCIHSEYGMTEILSQAYSSGKGIFSSPPWMKIVVKEHNDPFAVAEKGRNGIVNIIDLANLYSCPFIATSDIGKTTASGFEILGRLDFSELRGCNMMF